MVLKVIKINKSIQIVRTTISSLSSMNDATCEAIFNILSKQYSFVGVTIVDSAVDIALLIAKQPDLVFMGMKFVSGNPTLGIHDTNRIWLTDILEANGIAYTGSDRSAQELGIEKPLAKQRMLDAGIKTSAFSIIKKTELSAVYNNTLKFPLFIKPTNRGGGLGIDTNSVVRNESEFNAKVYSLALNLNSDSLVEEYLPGREFSAAILKDGITGLYSVMPLELIAPANEQGLRILTKEVKSADTESFIEITDKVLKAKICSLALKAFHALGACDYGRIDIRLDADNIPQFLEANLLPNLVRGYGNFPKACALNLGLQYEPMILKIVNLGLLRLANSGQDAPEPDVISGALQTV